MIWRFTILQYTPDIETVIEEPPGWDSITKTIQRDADMHGIVFNFSESNLIFIEEAYWIIKEEYVLNRVDGNIGLRIEWLCDECDGYQLFYEGKLDFQRYDEECGDDCSIAIGLEASDAEVLIKNRMDTAVDLTSNLAYDGVTALTDYAGLGKVIDVPGKSILIQSRAVNETTIVSDNLRDSSEWFITSGGTEIRGQIIPGFTKTIRTDLADTSFRTDIALLNGGFNNRPSTGQFPVVDVQKFSNGLQCASSDAVLQYRYKGHIDTVGGAPGARFKIFLLPKDADPENGASYTQLADHNLGASGNHYDFSNTVSITLNVGDKLFAFTFFDIPSNAMDYSSYVVTEDPECFIDISLASLCDPTPAKTYLIHEAGSRIFENITNNEYKFRSEYYGRTDSLPYAYAADGCGSLRTLTNGLQLRRAVLQDNSSPKVFLSPKDFYESVNAIDCIGMGIEGNDVRFEPLKYFYTDEIIFIADGVKTIKTTVRTDRVYNQFNFGYDKFETESTNGLDAIHTKRQYRLPIRNTDTKLEKISKLIADGYAIEVTRRKFGISDDWRYDQNIFLLCLKKGSRQLIGQFESSFSAFFTHNPLDGFEVGDQVQISGSASNNGTKTIQQISGVGTDYILTFTTPVVTEATVTITITNLTRALFQVEQNNITGAANLFDPPTVINYAISPIRNAMRWFKWLIQGVRDYANAKILFSSGDGNYVAKGKLNTGCIEEVAVVAENDPIQATSFTDANEAKPFAVPEKDSFTFPMGLNEFVSVAAKKYGKVQYRRLPADDWKYGWIDSIKYNPNDGDAEFSLITCKD